MQGRAELTELKDFFLPLSQRSAGGVYFVRVVGYSTRIADWIWQVHEAAAARGGIVENQISNPDEMQLRYYGDTLGTEFRADRAFISAALRKWMPRMSPAKQEEFAAALTDTLMDLRRAGKNDHILKNIYIKMMCWLYYRFERLAPFLGTDDAPKILYENRGLTNHELIFLRMLSGMGADIAMLEPEGDQAYRKLDPESKWSQIPRELEGGPFPPDFSLRTFRKQKQQERQQQMARRPSAPSAPGGNPGPRPGQPTVNRANPVPPGSRPGQPSRPGMAPAQRTSVSPALARPGVPAQPSTGPVRPISLEERFPRPARTCCTNAWMQQADMEQILTPPITRGEDPKLFYNVFLRMTGVRDRLTYPSELYQFYQTLLVNKRRVVIVDGKIPEAQPEELSKIRRRNYRSAEELIVDLAGNLPSAASVELQRLIQQAFVRVMKEEARAEGNLNRLTVTAVILLCWIRRYQSELFQGWKETDIPVWIKMGGCQGRTEAAYLRWLSLLPADVLILAPNLNQPCELKSDRLLELTFGESLPMDAFPKQSGNLQMMSAAAHAEQDLTTILYGGDSGLYRNKQYVQAETITLRTTYDEIFILWDQELKYRPNFSTTDRVANIPVIFAKISGVEEGKILPYWQKIKLLTEPNNALVFRQFPIPAAGGGNPFQALAVKSIRNERLKKDVIRSDRHYPFALIREEMQEHMLDKIQQMLDQRLIRGTFVNGTEYTVLSTVLNMKKELIRLIQGFDFTKKNPKVVVIHTRDQQATLEDAILLVFLNKIGFDVALCVPTGFQTIEPFLSENYLVEHQIGEYLYDQAIPDFSALQAVKGPSWLENIKNNLRRGR